MIAGQAPESELEIVSKHQNMTRAILGNSFSLAMIAPWYFPWWRIARMVCMALG